MSIEFEVPVRDGDVLFTEPGKYYEFTATEDCYVFLQTSFVEYSRTGNAWIMPVREVNIEVRKDESVYLRTVKALSDIRIPIINTVFNPRVPYTEKGIFVEKDNGFIPVSNTTLPFKVGDSTLAIHKISDDFIWETPETERLLPDRSLVLGYDSEIFNGGLSKVVCLKSDLNTIFMSDIISSAESQNKTKQYSVTQSDLKVKDSIINWVTNSDVKGNTIFLNKAKNATIKGDAVSVGKTFNVFCINGEKIYVDDIADLSLVNLPIDAVIMYKTKKLFFNIIDVNVDDGYVLSDTDLGEVLNGSDGFIGVLDIDFKGGGENAFIKSKTANVENIEIIGSGNIVNSEDVRETRVFGESNHINSKSPISGLEVTGFNNVIDCRGNVNSLKVFGNDNRIISDDLTVRGDKNYIFNDLESFSIDFLNSNFEGSELGIQSTIMSIVRSSRDIDILGSAVGVFDELIEETDSYDLYSGIFLKTHEKALVSLSVLSVELISSEAMFTAYVEIIDTETIKVFKSDNSEILKDKINLGHKLRVSLPNSDLFNVHTSFESCFAVRSASITRSSLKNAYKVNVLDLDYSFINDCLDSTVVVSAMSTVKGHGNKISGDNVTAIGFGVSVIDYENIIPYSDRVENNYIVLEVSKEITDNIKGFVMALVNPPEFLEEGKTPDNYTIRVDIINVEDGLIYTSIPENIDIKDMLLIGRRKDSTPNNSLALGRNIISQGKNNVLIGDGILTSGSDFLTVIGSCPGEIFKTEAFVVGIGYSDKDTGLPYYEAKGMSIYGNGLVEYPSHNPIDARSGGPKTAITRELLEETKIVNTAYELEAETDDQTDFSFSISENISDPSQITVYTEGKKDRVSTYSIEIERNTVTVKFDEGKDENDWVEIVIQNLVL